MILNEKAVGQSVKKGKDSKFVDLDLSLKQLISLQNIEKLIDVTTIQGIYASTNYIKQIDEFFVKTINLKELDLSVNHIVKIKNMTGLAQLQYLNLSNNRIKQIDGLDSLINLETLVK